MIRSSLYLFIYVLLSPTYVKSDEEPVLIKYWANKVISFSTEYTSNLNQHASWRASEILGSANIYPKYGDYAGTWAQAPFTFDDQQFIEVGFPGALILSKVEIYETFNAGGVRQLSSRMGGNPWKLLYQTDQVTVIRRSRIFSPPIPEPLCAMDALRIEVNCSVSRYYVEIDAVQIQGSRYECHQSRWGLCCDRICGNCWINNQCDYTTGVCPNLGDNYRCAAGYKGDKCDQECTRGEFGADCLSSCGQCAGGTHLCTTDTGMCPAVSPRCADGFKGDQCKNKCDGEYGPDCTEGCGHCAGGPEWCSNTTGECSGSPACLPGYKGDRCKIECDGEYGPDCTEGCGHCAGGPERCSKTTGECSGSPACLPGYKGDRCKIECDGEYGPDCTEDCGHCAWGPEWCSKTTGKCSGSPACLPGYKGDRCKIECDGEYGPDCREGCGHCAGGPEWCSKTTGECSGSPACLPGYKGDRCKIECERGNFGQGCAENCGHCVGGSDICAFVSGICPPTTPKCEPGYTGELCKDGITNPSNTPSTIIGGVIGAVVGVAIAISVLIIWIFRKIHKRKRTPDAEVETAAGFDPSGRSIYENEAFPGVDSAEVSADSTYETFGDDIYAQIDISKQESDNHDYTYPPSL